METILSLGKAFSENQPLQERQGARAVIFDDTGRVALMHVLNKGYYKLPGGGIDPDEDANSALARELLEEMGAEVEITDEIGMTEEWRQEARLHQISFCYVAKLLRIIQTPELTEKEQSEGFELFWASSLESAIDLVSNPVGKSFEALDFITTRDAEILRAANK